MTTTDGFRKSAVKTNTNIYSTMLTALMEDIIELELYFVVILNVFPSDNLSEERFNRHGFKDGTSAADAGRGFGYIINNKLLISIIKD